MASAYFDKIRSDVTTKLHEPNPVTNVLAKAEEKTGIDRFYFVAGLAGLFGMYLIFGHFAELVCNAIGFLYPAYASIKAIESASKDDDTQWLTYWVVFGLFNVIEFGVDQIVGWFPIYWLCKCAFLLYLHMPMTKGAQHLYITLIRPFTLKYQKTIDARFNQFMNKVSDGIKENAENMKQK